MMYRGIVCALAAAAALTGCATSDQYPSASPAFAPEAECIRNGGVWRVVHNFCEYPSPGLPLR